MVSRDIDQFKLKQTQGSCILFSYCLIMSYLYGKQPHEIMIKFVNDETNSSFTASNLPEAESIFLQNCRYNINNEHMRDYHLRYYSNSVVNIKYRTLKNNAHVIEMSKVLDEKKALVSAAYKVEDGYHCSPLGKDENGFYLIQTSPGHASPVDLTDIPDLANVNYVKELGDCLLLFKDS
ncbi:MAG: hypothetical protein K9N40_09140 [Candidatus Cloacimonetes bacterium]|nr:hypothetical protein [Candidatus Cloacimonadota bacterium]